MFRYRAIPDVCLVVVLFAFPAAAQPPPVFEPGAENVPEAPAAAPLPEPTVVAAEAGQSFDFSCTIKLKDPKARVTPASMLLGYKPGAPHLTLTFTHKMLTLAREAQGNVTVLATETKFRASPKAEGAPLVLQWRSGRLIVVYEGRVLLRHDGLEALQGAVALAPSESNLQFVEPRYQPVELASPEVKPVAVASQPAPVRLERGLFNLKATYCKEPDLGTLKSESRNQRIPWTCFKKRIFTQTVDTIDFEWTGQSPGSGMKESYWSARFVGKLLVIEEGSYTFFLDRLDDGGRLYVDGKPVIDAWLLQPPTTHSSEPLRLNAGVHDLRLDYCQGTLAGSVALSWSGPGFTKEVIPKTVLPDPGLVANLPKPQTQTSPGGPILAGGADPPSPEPKLPGQAVAAQPVNATRGLLNLKGTYCKDRFSGDLKIEKVNQPIPWRCFKKPLFTRPVDMVDFDWTDRSPGRGMPATYWSARFEGKLLVSEAGEYLFYLDRLDDGGRLYIDGKSVIDAWLLQPPTTYTSQPVHLTAGVHDLRLDYCQGDFAASITLSWSGPGFPKEIVPKAANPGSGAPVRVAAKAR
ncbi:MAG: hypothetical protein HY318_15315 [Armatimonadetes bacterium]|nr:hypothetical protein [Armatimonadota bacterium]